MTVTDRGIGSEGLEQGGPNLGNDYSRHVGARETGARDAIIIPKEKKENTTNDETLNMDNESSRNLSGEVKNYDRSLEDESDTDDDDMMEDDVLQGLDTEEDDDEDEREDENDII